MVMKEFRLLRSDEIDVRVQSVTSNGAILLLYKDARCDMNILDETVSPTGWQRRHEVVKGNLYCTVSIYDADLKQWVEKQDVGVESNTEAEKGEASDSFKRACFNWGIGRELYTAPFTFVELKSTELDTSNGKPKVKPYVKFHVSYIAYENKKITELKIVDQDGTLRFDMNKKVKAEKQTTEKEPVKQPQKESKKNGKSEKTHYAIITELIKGTDFTLEQVMKAAKRDYDNDKINELSDDQFETLYTKIQNAINREQAGA